MIKKLTPYLLCLFSLNLWGQTEDSIRVEQLFTDLLQQKKDSASIYVEIDEIKTRLSIEQQLNWVDFNEMKFFLFSGQVEKAKNQAEYALKQLGERSNTDKKAIKFHTILANSFAFLQNYEAAINSYKNALQIAEQQSIDQQIAYLNNNIANVFFSLHEYESAYKHALKAVQFLEKTPNDSYYPSFLSILSISQAKIGKLKEADDNAQKALKLGGKNQNVLAIMLSHHALGEVELSNDNYTDAKNHYQKSLDLSLQFNQSHIILVNYIGLLSVSLLQEDYTNAVTYGEEALKLVSQTNNQTTYFAIRRKLAEAYFGEKHYQKAYLFMKEALENYQEHNRLETHQTVNELLVKYETEKKDNELAQLRIASLNQQAETKRLWIWVLTISILFLILLAFFMLYKAYHKNRLFKLKQEQESAIFSAILEGEEKERTRLGEELHDGIASLLVGLKYRVETEFSDKTSMKQELITQIGKAHQDIRKVSHNLAHLPLQKDGLLKSLEIFAVENSTPHLQVNFQHFENDRIAFDEYQSLLIYRIIQELVQNAIKHGNASEVNIQTTISEQGMQVIVENNGLGFDAKQVLSNGGLAMIKRRIELLKGTIDVDSSPQKNGVVCVLMFSYKNKS